jgi:hypothetical protein
MKGEALGERASWFKIDYVFAQVKGKYFLAHLILVLQRGILEKTEENFIAR